MDGHPGGLLAINHQAGCPIYAHDDGVRMADYERRGWLHVIDADRPAVELERELLTHAGYDVPQDLTTHVYICGPVWRRSWPQLGIE